MSISSSHSVQTSPVPVTSIVFMAPTLARACDRNPDIPVGLLARRGDLDATRRRVSPPPRSSSPLLERYLAELDDLAVSHDHTLVGAPPRCPVAPEEEREQQA